MSDGITALRIISGHHVSVEERKQLSTGLLASLAVGGHLKLTQEEFNKLSPSLQFTVRESTRH